MKFFYCLLFCTSIILKTSSAVIYNLEDKEYVEMPPLFHLDEYERCVRPGGVYCAGDVELVSNTPSDLLNMIHEYSDHTVKHFNYTKLFYGICMTKRCGDISDENIKAAPRTCLEECLNRTFENQYQLKSRVTTGVTCNIIQETDTLETRDVAVIATLVIILMMNLIGSLYGFYNETGNGLLLSFSICHNWKHLTSPPAESDPRFRALRSLTGFRTITTMLVIMCHALTPYVISLTYPRDFELKYNNVLFHALFNGSVVIQTFIIVSGFLLTYNMLIYSEKNKITWWIIPKGIFMRWLRLIPLYVLVLAVKSSIIRLAGSGPFWQKVVMEEVSDCRRDWWLHVLFINNCVNYSYCMAETWYLAVDMQLHILGLVLFVLIYKLGGRLKLLTLMFIIGMIIPAVITYIRDLDATIILTPESARNFFTTDLTFYYTYKSSYGNISCFIMGVSMAYLMHHWQSVGFKPPTSKIYCFIYWTLLPAGFGILWIGKVFYMDAPRVSLYIRTVYSGLVKPVFGFIMAGIILGTMLQIENVYRGVLEWKGWTILGRVSFTAYIVHSTVVRYYVGVTTTLIPFIFFLSTVDFLGILSLVFAISVPCWLLVEAPFGRLVTLCAKNPKKEKYTRNKRINKSENEVFKVKETN